VSAPHGQRGSASLLVVALAGVVLLLGLAASFLVATAAAHRRAQAAADLAALAGATARQRGEDPCAAAAAVATGNGAGLAVCRLDGADVVVSVRVEGPRHLGQGWLLRGEARAGPSGPSDPAELPDPAGAEGPALRGVRGPALFRPGSLSPAIGTGALAGSRTVDAEEIRVGDVVTVNGGSGVRVTHRVQSVRYADGQASLVLKGDANNVPDDRVYVVSAADRVLPTPEITVAGTQRSVAVHDHNQTQGIVWVVAVTDGVASTDSTHYAFSAIGSRRTCAPGV